MDDNYAYKSYKGCNHAGMMSDNKLIDYVKTIIYDKNNKSGVTEGKTNAISKYDKSRDYMGQCNNKLFSFSNYWILY